MNRKKVVKKVIKKAASKALSAAAKEETKQTLEQCIKGHFNTWQKATARIGVLQEEIAKLHETAANNFQQMNGVIKFAGLSAEEVSKITGMKITKPKEKK